MYTIYLLLAILAVSILVAYATGESFKWMDTNFVATLAMWVSGLTLALMVLTIPIFRADANSRMQGIEAIRTMNTGGEGLEMTHWRTTVSKANVNLAEMKYYASNPWTSAWYPKAVLTVEPIR